METSFIPKDSPHSAEKRRKLTRKVPSRFTAARGENPDRSPSRTSELRITTSGPNRREQAREGRRQGEEKSIRGGGAVRRCRTAPESPGLGQVGWRTLILKDVKRVLRRYGSNIIFFNGLRDPWSGGGVLSNISKRIVAIVAKEGAHHVDLRFKTNEDPEWLKDVRKQEIKIIAKWISEYYHDLADKH
ncbi:hypothetical protein ACLB2K_065917 [Fragaria x ananassa]